MHSSNMGYGNVTPCQHGSKQGALIWECVAIILHQTWSSKLHKFTLIKIVTIFFKENIIQAFINRNWDH